MKLKYHIFAGILTGVAGMTMTSCSSDFLKEELTTEYSTDYLNTNQGVDHGGTLQQPSLSLRL